MKRFFAALVCAATIVASFAGCSYKDALSNNQQTTDSTQNTVEETTAPAANAADFNDDFDGLCNYFFELGYFAASDGKLDESKVTKMEASLVGAEQGNKYETTYNNQNVTIELYSYDTSNLNDTAKQVIESAKSDNSFTILDLPTVTSVYLSDNGKYLMIYNDRSIDKTNPDTSTDNYKHREQVIEQFREFHK